MLPLSRVKPIEADPARVPGDPPVDPGGRGRGGEATRYRLAVETAEHVVCRIRPQP